MTAPQARNAIRKALTGIIDPKPKKADITAMWLHFGNKCAFCRRDLVKKDREGHADHLVAAASGGHNHIYNRVLACAHCNGDEKLDQNWEDFLTKIKNPSEDIATRKQRIEQWQLKHKAQCAVDQQHLSEALRVAEGVIQTFNDACTKVRALRP